MKLTYEDYMKLDKERLAQLLVERDAEENKRQSLEVEPFPQVKPNPNQSSFLPCFLPGGICTNPFHDCVNCPRQFGSGGGTYSTNTFQQTGGTDKTVLGD